MLSQLSYAPITLASDLYIISLYKKFSKFIDNKKALLIEVLLRLEAPPGIGPGIEVLQTFALPLGPGA